MLIFDDQGAVVGRHLLGRSGLVGIDIAAGAWHTIFAISETAVCFEVKPGPWDPDADKEFAAWAPREGEPASEVVLQEWLEAID